MELKILSFNQKKNILFLRLIIVKIYIKKIKLKVFEGNTHQLGPTT